MTYEAKRCVHRVMCLMMLTTVIIVFFIYFFGRNTKERIPMNICTVESCAPQMKLRIVDQRFGTNESQVTKYGNDNETRLKLQKHENAETKSKKKLEAAYKRYYRYFYNDSLYENIMDMKPITFDPLYKNPCWYGTADNGPLNDNKLHCLPYFYIIGVKKSGTSDLYSRINNHPEVTAQTKEPAWFPRIRWNYVTGMSHGKIPKILHSDVDHRTIGFYVKHFFDNSAKKIRSHPSKDSKTTKYNMSQLTRYSVVVHGFYASVGVNSAEKNRQVFRRRMGYPNLDATPGNLMHNGNWTGMSGNEGQTEPRFTNLHNINHLTPNAKIIIIIRDPVTRLFSDFLHVTYHYDIESMTSEIFHDHVTQLTDAYKDCFNHWSMRRCIYNETIRLNFMKRGILLADSFICGFVAFYMKELLAVFGTDRIHTILTMEYERDMGNVLSKTFDFLKLSPLPQYKLKAIVNKKGRANAKNDKRRNVGPMLNHTRDMLYNFYEPYNKEMADLLNDSRYLFLKNSN